MLVPTRSSRLWATSAVLVGVIVAGLSCGGGGGGGGGDCVTCPPPTVRTLSRIVLSPSTATVMVGRTASFEVQGQDGSGTPMAVGAETVSWATGDPTIAGVGGGGTVTGMKPGATTLTASVGTIQGTASLTVIPVPVASVTVAAPATALVAGTSVTLTATTRDASGAVLTGRTVTWSSATPAVATVVAATGVVTAVAPGSAVITATSEGQTGTVTLTVTPIPVATVTVSAPSTSVVVGGTIALTATTRDASGTVLTGRGVAWSSGTPAVATVNATTGVVTAVAPGSSTITATSEGKSGSVTITVSLVPVATVTVTPSALPLTVGQTGALAATTKDAGGAVLTGRGVTWSSGTPGVATVDPTSGLVTAVAAGTSTISAKSESKVGTATVTVTLAPIATITVTIDSTSLQVGHTAQATAIVKDAGGAVLTGRTVAWTSLSPGVATVGGATGVITAVSAGPVQIRATAEGKIGNASLTVTAAPVPTGIRLPGVTAPVALDDNATTTVRAEVTDQTGAVMTTLPAGYAVTWTSTTASSATVTPDASGFNVVVSGVRGGRTYARASLVRTSTAAVLAKDSVQVNVQQVPTTITIASAKVDTGVVGTALPQLVVQVKDRFGGNDSGAVVAFQLTAPAAKLGTLSAAQGTTDATGQVRTTWTLSTLTGMNTVSANIPARPALASATTDTYGKAGAPSVVAVTQGDGMTGATGAVLRTPVVIRMTDQYGNPTAKAPFTWRQLEPDGTTIVSEVPSVLNDDGSSQPYTWQLTATGGVQTLRIVSGATTLKTVSATALVPATIRMCDTQDQSSCLSPGSMSWPASGNYSGIVMVFDAAGHRIPGVPVEIFLGGVQIGSNGTGTPRALASYEPSLSSATRVLAFASELRTHGPSAVDTPFDAIVASSMVASEYFVRYSDDVIDIRGASAGATNLDVSTASPVTPLVSARYFVTVPASEPALNCHWVITPQAGPTYPTLKVGDLAVLNFDVADCGDSKLLGITNISVSWTVPSNVSEPYPATVTQTRFTPPSLEILGASPGNMPLTIHIDYVKVGPRSFDEWPKHQDFPVIPITVVP
jgi:Bacterial surface proteins containing Ig-like domains